MREKRKEIKYIIPAKFYLLCIITYKVRSENGYGFLKPGLKTGVGNSIFWSDIGLDLEIQAAHPHQKFQGVPPPPGKTTTVGRAAILYTFRLYKRQLFTHLKV